MDARRLFVKTKTIRGGESCRRLDFLKMEK